MTAARPAGAQQDVCQFLCVHGTATFTFGMSSANVWERSKLLTAQMSATGLDLVKERRGIENTLRGNVERGFHDHPRHQHEMGIILVWLATTSDAAKEDPSARGFVLEFSDSPLSSRNPLNMTLSFVGPGNAAAAVSGTGPGGRFVHYWTEPTSEAVVKLCERFRARNAAGL